MPSQKRIQGGPGGPGPPTPVKTSQKKDGCCVGPQVLQAIALPLPEARAPPTR